MAKTHKNSVHGLGPGNCSCCGVHYSRCKRRSFIGDSQSATNRTTIINIGSVPGGGLSDWQQPAPGLGYPEGSVVIKEIDGVLYIFKSTIDNNEYEPEIPETEFWRLVGGIHLELGETADTAHRGDHGKAAYEHSLEEGNPHNTQIGDIENLQAILESKQDNLASGTNIKTINGASVLGSGNIVTPNDVYMGSSGINISPSNVISPVYGTEANTIAQGNDSRINNGQTAYEWGDHTGLYLPITGGTVTGVIKSPAPVADEDLANKEYVDSKASPFNTIDVTQVLYTDKAINVIPFNNTGMTYSEGSVDFGVTRDNIHTMGFFSFKQGVETEASGDYSSAFGNRTEASGESSSAFGQVTKASGPYSSAFGIQTEASGHYSSAFGAQTEASGQGSSAFGQATKASGNYSSAFGVQTEASGQGSSAFGNRTEASGHYSSAFGNRTEASGQSSSAFGSTSTASGDYSAALGFRSIANEYASLAIGRYSTDGAVETSWTVGSPIFKVGNGTSISNRRNAYVLYNNGRSEQIKDVEVTEIGQGFVLKSPDGTRWRIKVSDTGELSTEVVV